MFSQMGFVFVSGFALGILVILAAEAAILLYLLRRLNRRRIDRSDSNDSCEGLDPDQSIDFCVNKQGLIWILESNESIRNWLKERSGKEQKRRRDYLEVHPVRRFAHIRDNKLILSETDGSQTTVLLKDCSIEAVSASGLPSRKWGKRFPIRIESKISELYKGNRVFYIYLETSWEKEAWCKSLRLAACKDQDRLNWFTGLQDEFNRYLMSLNYVYPSFIKQSAGLSYESLDKRNKNDGSSSKVRSFLKKLSRKCSNKVNPSNREDRKTCLRRPYQDYQSCSSSGKNVPANSVSDTVSEAPDGTTISLSESQSSLISGTSDVDSEAKIYADEETLAWNLIIARLFFDARQHTGLKNSMQTRIQRILSNMRTPSYVGEVICCGVDTGSHPPYIQSVRVLPMEMNQTWAFDLDIEYCGGLVLDVETRVEVHDTDLQKGLAEASSQPNSVEVVSTELLEGLEDFEKQLSIPIETDDDSKAGSKGTKAACSNVSKWKSMLKNIAEQVSQVPISLSIRVASLRGTLRVHIKPPPSDRLWFGFTSMPDIEFDLASSVGEHKITNGHVAMFLINRFKTAIREAVVLPNCQSATIPWMMADKDDWVQRKIAPFMWLNQESAESKSRSEEMPKVIVAEAAASSSSATDVEIQEKSVEDLKTPLLGSGEKNETKTRDNTADGSQCRSISISEEEEPRSKKAGRRARMMDLGKKMGEKLEEKKRHIEEKSRHIVEKMRGPQ